MAPHILNSVIIDGIQYDNIPQMIANPISEQTAKDLTEMLIISESAEVTETWKAFIPGYTMCGKTGTAIIPIDANYYEDVTNTSFVGWAPQKIQNLSSTCGLNVHNQKLMPQSLLLPFLRKLQNT